MKKIIFLYSMCFALSGIFCLTSLPNNVFAQEPPVSAVKNNETLNNESVIQLTRSGLSESIIIAKIKTSNVSFDTSTAALQSLKKQGVSDSLILAMVQKASGMDLTSNTSMPVTQNSSVTGNFTIPDGTEIKIAAIEDVSGQKVVEGDPITFKVSEDVKINGATVIAKDTVVKGTVSSAKKKGMMGRGGELSIRIDSTQTVDGQKLKLRATKSGEGGNNMGSTVALTVLFGPIGLLRRGKEAKIKAGTILSAFTDETKNITVSR